MTRNVLLNNVDHRDLRVITAPGARYGDGVMYAVTFPAEFRDVQAHYPIVFSKMADGQFQPVALFGFEERQNLFLTEAGWDATYIPLMIERLPFLIGKSNGQLVIHIDLDNPRVSRTAGEALFRAHGGTTELTERKSSVLLAIHEGLERTPAFTAALLEHELLESFVLDVTLNDGSEHRLAGFHAIHEERLAALKGPALESLNAAGHLLPACMAVASMSNLRALIERRNRLHAEHR